MVTMDTQSRMEAGINTGSSYGGGYLQKFRLYETRSNFYMIGWDKDRTFWKVLKVNRLEKSELSIIDDSATYSEIECNDLLKRIHEGNLSTGGLKFVTTCYGIVGFIKFLGPYYLLLITKRKKIGTICGHAIYSIAKSEMIQISDSILFSNMSYTKNENRYKKLLRVLDLTKDFYFSYSYNVMQSFQKNLSQHETGPVLYDTLFVWNEFLTRGIRKQLKNSIWTVALVYGFFKQVKVSISGRHCYLTLIARRSRHYAGTRYLKRGVNEKGRAANDVETEQIVLQDVEEGSSIQISSVVQNRGSIPLFWSQEASRLNIKPNIILSKKDDKYRATRLHFDNLVQRYGHPVIILNLIKTREKKPRESMLHVEFANAIKVINKDLPQENHLMFLHWDLSRHSQNKETSVLEYLMPVASTALSYTGFLHCHVLPSSRVCNFIISDGISGSGIGGSQFVEPPTFQKGVLRTNCIDCLDRTNIAQFVYGVVAFGQQLHALGYLEAPNISLDTPLGDEIMKIYEAMGDTLALQYGGSGAHNKIFSERRGQWKAAIRSQEIFKSLQRYYNNTYMDSEKQDAINVFLGHFQPQHGKPALWELDSDQHYNVGIRGTTEEQPRSIIKRSLSDGSILCGNNSAIDGARDLQTDNSWKPLPVKIQDCNITLQESNLEVPCCERVTCYPMCTPSIYGKKIFPDVKTERDRVHGCINAVESEDSYGCSNFLNLDRLSSSKYCFDKAYRGPMMVDSLSTEESTSSGESRTEVSSSCYSGSSLKGRESMSSYLSDIIACGSNDGWYFSARFIDWVANGGGVFLP